MKKITVQLALIASLLLTSAGAQQKSGAPAKSASPTTSATLDPNKYIVITGGKLLTITHGTIENGELLIYNGKITAVGAAGAVKVRFRQCAGRSTPRA